MPPPTDRHGRPVPWQVWGARRRHAAAYAEAIAPDLRRMAATLDHYARSLARPPVTLGRRVIAGQLGLAAGRLTDAADALETAATPHPRPENGDHEIATT